MASSAEYCSKKATVSNRKRLPCLTRERLEEFKAVMQIRDKVEGLRPSRFLPAPRVFISGHANTGKKFSVAVP